MNIWDSVQRGLEKASHEAARIAKTQRLRATIDTLSRQIQIQHSILIQKTMELFVNGQLTQSELLAICQNLISMQQQLAQAQNELKQMPSQPQQTSPSTLPTGPGSTGPYPPATAPFPTNQFTTGESLTPTFYAPPPPVESSTPTPIPPPPPGFDPTISQQRTMMMADEGHVAMTKITCPNCHSEVLAGHAYCQNCGAPVKAETSYLPTMRGTLNEQPTVDDARTIRATEANMQQDTATFHTEHTDDAAQSNKMPSPPTPQDGGY